MVDFTRKFDVDENVAKFKQVLAAKNVFLDVCHFMYQYFKF